MTEEEKKTQAIPLEEPEVQEGIECGMCADTSYQAVTSEEEFQALLRALNGEDNA